MTDREMPPAILAEWDRQNRRCAEHNRARWWCGCAAKDPKHENGQPT